MHRAVAITRPQSGTTVIYIGTGDGGRVNSGPLGSAAGAFAPRAQGTDSIPHRFLFSTTEHATRQCTFRKEHVVPWQRTCKKKKNEKNKDFTSHDDVFFFCSCVHLFSFVLYYCLRVYLHVYVGFCIAYVRMYLYACVRVCVCVCVGVNACICVFVCARACVCDCVFVCLCVRVRVCTLGCYLCVRICAGVLCGWGCVLLRVMYAWIPE